MSVRPGEPRIVGVHPALQQDTLFGKFTSAATLRLSRQSSHGISARRQSRWLNIR